MAIFSKLFIASSLLASFALAAPVNHARDVVTDIVTETVWTTLDFTTTVYSDNMPATSQVSTSSTAATTALSVSSPVAAEVEASTPVASMTTSPAEVVPVSSTTSAMTSALATTSAAGLALASTHTVSQSMSAVASADIAASSSGTCEGTSNACVGDVTHWDGGLGACGTIVDTNTDYAIALPYQFMGTLSNTNPYCGRSVTLLNPTSGTTIQAVVADKCMGCVDRAIDCTDILFNAITDGLGNGRESGIEWWLN